MFYDCFFSENPSAVEKSITTKELLIIIILAVIIMVRTFPNRSSSSAKLSMTSPGFTFFLFPGCGICSGCDAGVQEKEEEDEG